MRKINNGTVRNIKNFLMYTKWDFHNEPNANDFFAALNNTIVDALELYAPEKEVVIPAKQVIRENWMTKGFKKSSNTCNKLYQKSIGKDKDHQTSQKYIKYRNLFNKIKKHVKRQYYADELMKYKDDLEKTWGIYRKLIGRTNDKYTVPDMFNINDREVTDPNFISQKFCEYFTNIGKNKAINIGPPKHQFTHYLTGNSMYIAPSTTEEVYKILTSLTPKKSSGNDDISNFILKAVGDTIATPLSISINKSLSEGTVPKCCKIGKGVPIYKTGNKHDMNNYRPISPCFQQHPRCLRKSCTIAYIAF